MKEIRMLKEKGKPDGVREKTDGLLGMIESRLEFILVSYCVLL